MIKTSFFAGALLAAIGATMSPASAATTHVNLAFRGAVAYRMSAARARFLRAPVGYRAPVRPARVAGQLAWGAYGRTARPAYAFNRFTRPASAYTRAARPGYGRLAYRGYGRVAQRVALAAPAKPNATIFGNPMPRVVAPPVIATRAVVATRTPAIPVPRRVGGGGMIGGASYYSGGRTASGGLVGAATCAHRSLPFGTRLLVTNMANSRSTICTVNDRGPFVGGRVVDLARGAAGAIGMLGAGVAPVRLQIMGRS